ncbi:MAG: hypothetical protein ABH868_07725 [bacterium]
MKKALLLFLLITFTCYPLIADADLDFKGLAYMSREYESTLNDPDGFIRNNSDESLENMSFTGANYVALIVTQYMSGQTTSSVYSKPTRTPTDVAIAHAIDKAHELGMNVMMKMHIDVEDGTWRGDITPSDTNAWFNSYNTAIVHYAQIAQAHYQPGDVVCVGTELRSMSRDYDSNWTAIINNLQLSFSGELTYAANWDEYTDVSFWDELDYAGIDAYFALSDLQDPSLQNLLDGWLYYDGNARYVNGPRQWVNEIEAWQSSINKPVIFTEIGYRSKDQAAMEPWDWENGAVYNGELQARCYEAAFLTFKDRTWFKGLFFWSWFTGPDAGHFGETLYTPQNKPAENTLTIYYEGGKSYTYDFEDGTTQGWFNDTSIDFMGNLGLPYNATDQVHRMYRSLAFPLNLDDKHDAGTPGNSIDDYINDVGYVRPVHLNLTGYNGIRCYVYIPTTANISDTKPAVGSIYVKTGDGWVWYESNYAKNITLGDWTEVTLNLSLAKNQAGTLNQPVSDVDDIKELGVHISGAGDGSGTTILYVDSVEYEGTSSAAIITVTVEGVTIGVSITGSYDFGLMQMGDQKVSDSPLVVTNTGTAAETYAMYLMNPPTWTAVDTNAGNETYVLGAVFNSGQPAIANFGTPDDSVLATPKQCDSAVFAGNQTGVFVPAGITRDLWLLFKAPVMTASQVEQRIRLIISAEAS